MTYTSLTPSFKELSKLGSPVSDAWLYLPVPGFTASAQCYTVMEFDSSPLIVTKVRVLSRENRAAGRDMRVTGTAQAALLLPTSVLCPERMMRRKVSVSSQSLVSQQRSPVQGLSIAAAQGFCFEYL